MSRNRVIYQSEALYVSKNVTATGSGDHRQLARVQSANYNFNIQRQDVNQFGELARIDSIVLESPTVSLDFSYYLTDGQNEKALGFYVQNPASTAVSQFPSGQLRDESGVNFYIFTTDEGDDLNSETGIALMTGKSVVGIGNAFLTDYSVDFSVGNIPTVSVSYEGQNMNAFTLTSGSGIGYTGIVGPIAGINSADGTKLGTTGVFPLPSSKTGSNTDNPSALRPGDITLSFGNIGGSGIVTNLTNLNVQSVSVSLPLGRTPIEKLGSKFAFARVVDFPVTATLTVNGVQSDVSGANSLVDLIEANPKNDITITINKPGSNPAVPAVQYTFKQAQLDSAGLSSSIGANKTADLTFSTQIGGVNDVRNGVQMSGFHNGAGFPS
jgi:hypothetical protein